MTARVTDLDRDRMERVGLFFGGIFIGLIVAYVVTLAVVVPAQREAREAVTPQAVASVQNERQMRWALERRLTATERKLEACRSDRSRLQTLTTTGGAE